MSPRKSYSIILASDIHCGDPRFDEHLISTAISEINSIEPDLFVVAGDLTAKGYREEFEEAKHHIDLIDCDKKVVIAGNHDHRNVGWVFFEELFGRRFKTVKYDFDLYCHEVYQDKLNLIAADSSKPDLDEGEIGRQHYDWIKETFSDPNDFKVFVLHHHLVSVPGTGRERNIVWDAGDVLEVLKDAEADLVLCGHRHVPYVWTLGKTIIVNSGTMATLRTRGYSRPAYMSLTVDHESISISTHVPGEGIVKKDDFLRSRIPPKKIMSA